MLHRLCRVVCCAVALASGLARAEDVILTFHRVGAASGLTLGVGVEQLEAQIGYLQRAGYRFGTLASTASFGGATAFITFDDGFQDVFETAFPTLSRMGVPATVFVVVAKVGTPGFMTWGQLRTLAEAGWLVGSHGQSHDSLVDLTTVSIRHQLQRSRDGLGEHLDLVSGCVAYPFGRHDQRVRIAAGAIYGCGLGTGLGTGAADPLAVSRPLATPFDGLDLGWRLDRGHDLRTPLILAELGYWLLPSNAPPTGPPRFYNPARHRFMGSGRVGVSWQNGVLYQDFFYREGALALSGASARVGGAFSEAGVVWAEAPFSVGFGFSSYGPFLAAGVSVYEDGELWASVTADGHLALGLEAVPADHLRLRGHYHTGAVSGEVRYGLPILAFEGRPLRVSVGYDRSPYVGASFDVGSLAFEATLSLAGSVGLGVSVGW